MLKVGLTGGIGAGKSTLAAVLASRGAQVIDADRLAREVVAVGSPGLVAVVREFGPHLVSTDGELDRAALGQLVFTDPQRRLALERITHPLVAERTEQLVRAAPSDVVVVHDVPLLVERQMGADYHLVIVADAPEQVRLERLKRNRGMRDEAAWARIRAQASPAQRRAASDVWVDTDRPLALVAAEVERLWDERLKPFEHNVRTGHRVRRPERLVLVGSDPQWSAQAARLLARIARAAGRRCRGTAHIGSTAVPGLLAKPVLDLQLGIDSLEDVEGLCRDLAAAGFVVPTAARTDGVVEALDPNPAHWNKLFGGGADPAVLVHLHVRVHDGPAWRTALLLRDWWRADPRERTDYATAKQRLRLQTVTATEYAAAKEPWMAAAVDRALSWAARTGWRPPPA